MKTNKQHKTSSQKTFNMRSHIITGLTCGSLLILAACGGTNAGEASPSQDSGSTAGSNSAKYGAPSVPAPLAVHSIVDDPCSVLPKEQIDEFPGTLNKTDTSATTYQDEKKTTCRWIFQGDRYSYGAVGGGVVLPSAIYHGISSIYKTEKKGKYEVFEPIELDGYPAVINGSEAETTEGACRVSVGLRDDTAYRITVLLDPSNPDYDEPCNSAKRLGKFVVKNLKEAD